MQEVSLFWGLVAEIKENKVSVRSRAVRTGFIDVLAPISGTKEHSSLVKINDPVLVFSVSGLTVAILTSPAKNLKLDEGTFDVITYSDGSQIKVADKKLEITGFEEVLTKSKQTSVVADKVTLGSENSVKAGVVTRRHVCAFTGLPHPQASTEVECG